MAVTISLDIGTTILPVALNDCAIAYCLAWDRDREHVFLDVRNYTLADVQLKRRPMDVFTELKNAQPGKWFETYSNTSSLLNIVATDPLDKFIRLKFHYDRNTFSWKVTEDPMAQWLRDIAANRTNRVLTTARLANADTIYGIAPTVDPDNWEGEGSTSPAVELD